MKDNKITFILDEQDAKKFNEISKKTKWQDKTIMTMVIRNYYKMFKKDWKRTVNKTMASDEL